MACSDYTYWTDALEQWAFQDAILCPYQTTMDSLLFGLLVVGSINMALYAKQESVLLPLVVTMLTGSILLVEVAGVFTALVRVGLLFLVGLGPVLLLRRAEGMR